MPLSDDLRAELAAIAPTRGCCRLAELSALFHSAGTRPPARPRRDRAPPRPRHVRRSRGAPSRCCASSGSTRRSAPTAGARSTARPATSSTSPATTPRSAMLVEAGVLDARHAPLERPPKRVVGRSCCRGAYLRGALLGGGSLSGPRVAAPRAPHDLARGRRVPALRRRGKRRRPSASSTAAATRSPTRRASTRSRPCSAPPAPATRCSRFEERAVVAAARGEANRLANADHANLVRTSRAAQEQLEAVRALQAAGTLERLPDRLYEVARLRLRHPTLSLRELAAKCDPPSTKASVHRRLKKLEELVRSSDL